MITEYLKFFHSDSRPGRFLIQLQIEDLSHSEAMKINNMLADMIAEGFFKSAIQGEERE